MRIQVYTGERCMREFRDVMAANGWGYMIIADTPPQAGEPWAMDNGAFRYAQAGEPFDGAAFLARVGQAERSGTKPAFCVLPDTPVLSPSNDPLTYGAMGYVSLQHSLLWAQAGAIPLDWDWFLAVQDGMETGWARDIVRGFIQEYGVGLFLGGSDKFKQREAEGWCRLAHEENVPFHYGRCGSLKKLRHAYQIGADSCDSALILWSRNAFYRYEQEWKGLGQQQFLGITAEAHAWGKAPMRAPKVKRFPGQPNPVRPVANRSLFEGLA